LVTTDHHREILAEVAALYRHQASTSQEFSDYLDTLCFDATQRQGLGWAPRDGVGLRGFFDDEDQKILLDLGLLDRKGNHTFERIRHAIIFPVTHCAGAAVGFVGRRLENQPKYLNSRFPKRVFPLGLAEARESIMRSGIVTLVEGPFDWLALRAEGVNNVLALLGSDISLELLSLLRVLGVRSANVLLDGDTAGRAAAEIAVSRLQSVGIDACLLELPAEADPADLWCDKGPGAIQAVLESQGTSQNEKRTEGKSNADSKTS
jgi:DNA primase